MDHVEFMGIPGCGKSTVFDRVRAAPLTGVIAVEPALIRYGAGWLQPHVRLLLPLVPAGLRRRLAWRNFRRGRLAAEIAAHVPKTHAGLLESIRRSTAFQSMTDEERGLGLRRFTETAALLDLLSTVLPREERLLLDEGLMQRSAGLFVPFRQPAAATPAGDVSGYLRGARSPGMVFYFAAEPAVCLERLRGRSRGLTRRMRGAGPGEILDFLVRSAAHFQGVAEWLERNSAARLVRIDGAEKPETIARRIRDLLHGVLNQRPDAAF